MDRRGEGSEFGYAAVGFSERLPLELLDVGGCVAAAETTTELRYWQAIVHNAEAELDAATTHADLRLAAQRLMRARRRLLTLQAQTTMTNDAKPPRRRRRPPQRIING